VVTPDQVTASDFQQMGLHLRPDEKCHIALIAVEARKQADLIYGLRAISDHLTGSHTLKS